MEVIEFGPTYKTDCNLVVINEDSIPIPNNFRIVDRSLIFFPPGSKGGNHKHPRKEIFYSLGDLTLVYEDKNGKNISVSMGPDAGIFKLFVIDPFLPHAVVNNTDKELVLVEFANAKQSGVEKVLLI